MLSTQHTPHLLSGLGVQQAEHTEGSAYQEPPARERHINVYWENIGTSINGAYNNAGRKKKGYGKERHTTAVGNQPVLLLPLKT